MLAFFTSIKIVALLSYVVLGLLILRSKAERSVRIFFSIYLFGMLFWQLGSVTVNFLTDAGAALFLYNLMIAGSGTYTILFFPFARAFVKVKSQRVLTVLAYVTCVVQFTTAIVGLQLQEVQLGRGGYWVPVYTSTLMYALSALSFFFWGCGLYNLVRGVLREKSVVQKNRILYVLLGASVVIIGASTNLIGLRDYPVDISANLASALIIGYAVVRFRLLEIRVILVRSLFYSILTAGGIAFYLGIVFGLEGVLKLSIGYSGPLYPIIAILVIAIVFLPFRNALQKGLDRIFFREKADYQNVTQVFSRDITSLYDASDILALVASTVSQTVKVGSLSIAILDGENQVFRVEKSIGPRPLSKGEVLFGVGTSLVQWLRRADQPLVREEAELNPETRPFVEENKILFDVAGTSVVVPILLRDKLLGALNLGPKRAGTMYSRDDLRFLTTIANQTATALEKTSAYREIQRRLSEQTLLFILSERFRGTTDFDSIMQSVVRILKSFLACDYCALVYHETTGEPKIFALDALSAAAASVVSDARLSGGLVPTRGQDPYPLGERILREIARRSPDLGDAERSALASFMYLPLSRDKETFGAMIVPNRTGVEPVDQREVELLRTIRAIISQGIVLHRTIVNLVNVTKYNTNILNSLNAMGDTLVILDLAGKIISVNKATCKLLGFTEEELIGQHIGKLASEDRSLFLGEGLSRFVGEESISNYEVSYQARDGKLIPMLFSGSVMAGEDGKTREIVGIARDITEHRKAEEMAKNILLVKEVHHRIKNNLQVISSLLYLQSGYVQDAKTREMFKESQNRVRSMALLHEKLYQSRDLSGVDFAEYIKDLTRNLLASYGVSTSRVDLEVAAAGISLGMDTAVPCGLIINELVSNSFKHAFVPSQPGEIRIEITPTENAPAAAADLDGGRWYQLVVSDNGKGFPESINFRSTESLGLKLVCTLTDQLSGTIDLERNHGTRFTILFKGT